MTRERASYSYVAHGLGIRSTFPFPELTPGEGDADVLVRPGKVEGDPPDGAANRVRHRSTVDETRLFLESVGRLLVRRGKEIVVDAARAAAPGTVRAFVLGPGIATLLAQRGRLVLHASAVEIEDRAIALLGGSGWGKSTTAAALNARGYALVADDVLALDLDSRPVQAFPGFPQLKLWREAAAYLRAPAEEWTRYNPLLDKGFQPPASGVAVRPLALAAACILDEGEEVEVEALSPRDAAIEFVRHSWAAGILRTTAPREHFANCSTLARNVPLFRLRRPQVLERLADVLEMIESQMAGVAR
ncbi:MAG: hypothetical protein H0U03_12140 [Actinobacteria bacterium]|nr:hypothetical protein [Actinomycetota bacterium]